MPRRRATSSCGVGCFSLRNSFSSSNKADFPVSTYSVRKRSIARCSTGSRTAGSRQAAHTPSGDPAGRLPPQDGQWLSFDMLPTIATTRTFLLPQNANQIANLFIDVVDVFHGLRNLVPKQAAIALTESMDSDSNSPRADAMASGDFLVWSGLF